MENFLEGGVEQLEAVKSAITDLAQKEQVYKETDRSLKAKQKELDLQRKRVDEKISQTIKKARAELEKGYDDQISGAEKAIKEAELKRKNAKQAAMNLRMKMENSSLVDENKVLEAEIDAKFKENSIPGFCKSKLYYALFAPTKTLDFVYVVIMGLICAGLIPFIVTRFVEKTVWQVVVWILIAVFFAAIYFLIAMLTKKGSKNDVIQQMRSSVDRIADNKKFIKKRNKNIKADPDESQYNLTEYDEMLNVAKSQYEALVTQKAEAVQEFENVESVSIREKMEEEKAPLFQELEKEIELMSEDLRVREESFHEAEKLMEDYAGDLGEKAVKAEKIDELINLINEGKAATVQEALDARKENK